MKTEKTLIETNPYLKDPTMGAELIARSVETSCGVEGINLKLTSAKSIAAKFNIKHRSNKRIYNK